jgi:hypothetical protein
MAAEIALMMANGLLAHPDDFDHDASIRARQDAEALVSRHIMAAGAATTSTPNMVYATTSHVTVISSEAPDV